MIAISIHCKTIAKLLAGSDSDKLEWLRQNLDTIKIPEVTALLDFLAARAVAGTAAPQMTIPLEDVWGEFFRLIKSRMKTPRGGALGGGSMQTMFEMPMVTAEGAKAMFDEWPTKSAQNDPCWELSTMLQCETHLAFQLRKTAHAWGWGNGRPICTSSSLPSSLLLAAPPFTVRLRKPRRSCRSSR